MKNKDSGIFFGKTSCRLKPGLLAILMVCVVPNTYAGDPAIHKCKNKEGRVIFQDSPCPEELAAKERQLAEKERLRREASARFDERVRDQQKAIDAAPNPKILKEWLEPERQPASANQREALKEMTATILNLNGLLCAQIITIRPLGVKEDVYEVTCVEYRGGSSRKAYLMDVSSRRTWAP